MHVNTTFRSSTNPHFAATMQLVVHCLNAYSHTVGYLLIIFKYLSVYLRSVDQHNKHYHLMQLLRHFAKTIKF
jgi:hypothetical protein